MHNMIKALPPERLDEYLTAGWRPSGQTVYNADCLRTDDGQLHGVIQVRLPLENYAPKKRHRKLLARNGRRFTYRIERAGQPDEAMLALNQRYKLIRPNHTRDDLEGHVYGTVGQQVLDTYQVRVFDGDRLVAFSYFDRGVRTGYSKAGVYDPDYQRSSLGIYTMLLEIAWLRDHGVRYYHPGYVSPTYPIFNYKLSFGPMEYRRVTDGGWYPYEEAEVANRDPYRLQYQALDSLHFTLDNDSTIPYELEVYEYISFTARFHYPDTARLRLLDGQIILTVRNDMRPASLVVTYAPTQGTYQLWTTGPTTLQDSNQVFVGRNGLRRYPFVLRVEGLLRQTESREEMGAYCRQLLSDR